jgi:hypothetical protein
MSSSSGGALPPSIARPLIFAAVASGLDASFDVLLYLRQSPLGGDFAMRPAPYLLRAIYYGVWGHTLIALPFILFGLYRWHRGRGPSAVAAGLQLLLTTLLLLVAGVDREFQRFLGMHVSAAWLTTYQAVERTPDVIWNALREDRGGSWSSLWGLGVVVLAYVPLCLWLRSLAIPMSWVHSRRRSFGLVFGLLIWPTILWNFIPGGGQRLAKIRPAVLTVLKELRRAPLDRPSEAALAQATATFQNDWLVREGSASWAFEDPDYPLHRTFRGPQPAEPGRRPNFILLALETFRAKEMPSFNPDAPKPSPTPFLDALAQSERSAFYPRYYTTGVPTVHAFMSLHTGLLMHPTRVPAESTSQHLAGFPEALRAHGYRTLHFTGSDPDWDSQRVWLRHWYDEIDYRAEDGERDRVLFRRASQRLREVGAQGQPFFAYVASISNHTPFRSPEPALDITTGDSARDSLRNTMHYTDDVVRELYESLKGEPWFDNTIWIVTGDHAFDLGDRGEVGGHENLRHETTWVPLIVHGPASAALGRGRQERIASHIDLAPTISELAGVFDDNSYMGHSMLSTPAQPSSALILRGLHYAYETQAWSMYRPPEAAPFVYAGADLPQSGAAFMPEPGALERADELALAARTLVAYVIDFDRHSRPRDVRVSSRH